MCCIVLEREVILFASLQIAKELQVEGNKVESWVIRAISSKLIEAQIDQMKQVVVVS